MGGQPDIDFVIVISPARMVLNAFDDAGNSGHESESLCEIGKLEASIQRSLLIVQLGFLPHTSIVPCGHVMLIVAKRDGEPGSLVGTMIKHTPTP